MLCPNCGANLNDGSTYCLRCGNTIDESGFKIEKKDVYITSEQREVLEQEYIGKKYGKFLYSDFNIWHFLFGYIYCFYRRYYSYGVINAIISAICYFIGEKLMYIISRSIIDSKIKVITERVIAQECPYMLFFPVIILIIGSFILTKSFNKKYRIRAAKKVKDLIDKNPTSTYEDLKVLVHKKGRPSILFSLIGTIIFSFIIMVIMGIITGIYFIYVSIEKKNEQKIVQNACNIIEESKKTSKYELFVDYDISGLSKLRRYKGKYVFMYDDEIYISIEKNFIDCSGTCNKSIKCN